MPDFIEKPAPSSAVYRRAIGPWYRIDMPAGSTNSSAFYFGTATGCQTTTYMPPRPGSVVAISFATNGVPSAGSIVIRLKRYATNVTGCEATLAPGASIWGAYATFAPGTYAYAAGEEISLTFSSASLSPTTLDVVAVMEIQDD